MYRNDLVFSFQESSSKGHVMEGVGRKTPEGDFDTIFSPPPEFQSSPLDLETGIKTVQNGPGFSEPQNDLFQALASNQMQGQPQMSAWPQNTTANGHFHDVTPNSSDLFKPLSAQTQNLSKTLQLKSSDLFKDEGFNLFNAAKEENLFHAERNREGNLFETSPSIFEDPFTSPSNKEDDLFQSSQPLVTNPFHTATTNGGDLFQANPIKSGELFHKREIKQDPAMKEDLFGMSSLKNVDLFSPSSANTSNPFPSPITRDLFQDFSSLDDPFSTTPAKQYDPFEEVSNGTPDIFQPLPSKTNGKDIFEITPSNATSMATYRTPSLNSPLEMKMDMLLFSPDLFKETPSKPHPADPSSNKPLDLVLTTPQGTKHNILQPTPFTRARNLSMSQGHSPPEMTHVCSKCHLIFGQPET